MLGDGTRTHAKVVAIYTRALGFGDALLAPELAAGHQTTPLLGTILVHTGDPAAVGRRLRALAARYPGLRVSDRASVATATDADRETNRWLGPLFVAIIFAFTSIAVVNTLIMIALQRGRELGLLQLVGGTPGQIRSMARWEAGLIITIGLGLGLAIAATALLPLSHALTGNLRPYVPLDQLAAILGVSALLALLALTLPTRRALRSRPVEAIGVGRVARDGDVDGPGRRRSTTACRCRCDVIAETTFLGTPTEVRHPRVIAALRASASRGWRRRPRSVVVCAKGGPRRPPSSRCHEAAGAVVEARTAAHAVGDTGSSGSSRAGPASKNHGAVRGEQDAGRHAGPWRADANSGSAGGLVCGR